MIIICIVGILICVGAYFLHHETFALLLLISLMYVFFGHLPQTTYTFLLIGKKKIKQLSVFNAVLSILTVCASTVVVYVTKDIIYYALAFWGTMTVVPLIVWLWSVLKYNLIHEYKIKQIDKQCYKYGLLLIPIDLIKVTAQKLSHFFIGYFIGLSQLAIFSISYKLKEKVAELVRLVPNLIYADLARKSREESIQVIKKNIVKLLFAGVILMIVSFVCWYFYIKLFLPAEYFVSINYLAILLLAIPVVLVTIILHSILVAHLGDKELIIIGTIPSILGIVLIVVLGFLFKLYGVVIALSLNAWVTFAFYYYLTIKKEKFLAFIKSKKFYSKLELLYKKVDDRL